MKFKKVRRLVLVFGFVLLIYFVVNAVRIYNYSSLYYESKSDIAIVLGAGTNLGKVSPVFKERINHAIFLYKKGVVKKLLFTGGVGKNQKQSDSQSAKDFAIANGVSEVDILIEENSKFTIGNLRESKLILDDFGFKSTLLVSDPLHMKRAMILAENYNINCKPSPTKTTMYRSVWTKTKSLIYETFYFSIREVMYLFC